jgi:hypothetical protein
MARAKSRANATDMVAHMVSTAGWCAGQGPTRGPLRYARSRPADHRKSTPLGIGKQGVASAVNDTSRAMGGPWESPSRVQYSPDATPTSWHRGWRISCTGARPGYRFAGQSSRGSRQAWAPGAPAARPQQRRLHHGSARFNRGDGSDRCHCGVPDRPVGPRAGRATATPGAPDSRRLANSGPAHAIDGTG